MSEYVELQDLLKQCEQETELYKERIDTASKILQNRTRWGVVDVRDIRRVLNGQLYYYVKFPKKYATTPHPYHSKATADGYAVIKNAADMEEATKIADEAFGPEHLKVTSEANWNFGRKFPKGEVITLDAEEYRRDK